MSTHKQTVLFDIDGTLADITHRRGYLDGDRPNWAKFNATMGDDTPFEPICALYRTLWETGAYNMVLVTGRSADFRKITEQWLVWNALPYERLLMRKANDYRADYIVKEEILDRLLAGGEDIAFTVDDRQQVVDMWRRRGITCLQCDEGDF
ncbi:MAG: hypothetical protein JKX69_02630 [Rhodobacteraceae bacterium]|nr:hypothetical protein [Paracoccaceae bacterium]